MSRGLVTNELAFRDVEHYENWQRRFLAFGVQVEIRAKNSRYSIFTLLHLCFVFYGEIYIKNGLGKISAQPHTIVKQIWLPSGNVLFLLLFSLSKNWMHNVGWGCAEILPCKFPFHRDCKDRGYRRDRRDRRDRRAGQTEQKMNKFMVIWFKGKGEMMTRGMDFRKPRLGEYMAPSSLSLCQYLPEVSHCSRNRISVRKAQERAWTAWQMMHFCYQNTMETTIGKVFIQSENRKCSHEKQSCLTIVCGVGTGL